MLLATSSLFNPIKIAIVTACIIIKVSYGFLQKKKNERFSYGKLIKKKIKVEPLKLKFCNY